MSSLEYLHHRQQLKLGLVTKPEPEQKQISKISQKKKQEIIEQKPVKVLLEEWFNDRISEMKGICMECGEPINITDRKFAKMSVAHVLPKRKEQFPSVSTHPENSMELCVVNGCHPRFDKSWDEASKMKVWPLAIEKFKIIYPAIARMERKHIPDLLLQELDPK